MRIFRLQAKKGFIQTINQNQGCSVRVTSNKKHTGRLNQKDKADTKKIVAKIKITRTDLRTLN